jgi:4-amino-4-deoxychorismate lyase
MHFVRMARSAAVLGYSFDEGRARMMVAAIDAAEAKRCRMTLDQTGAVELILAPMSASAVRWRVAIAQAQLRSDDFWLQHKTTQRALYDQARADLPEGIDELLFVNERGELCEGTITNVFLELDDGRMVTPALGCGVLPGVFRQEMLESGQVVEAIVSMEDAACAARLWVGNSLRGLIPVDLVA